MKDVQSVLANTGTVIDINDYDGIIVKQLKASNTLGDRSNTNQTHIAITGDQMDIFPCILTADYTEDKKALKKYLTLQVPMILYNKNLEYLDTDNLLPGHGDQKVYVSVTPRKNREQIQLHLLDKDSPNFISFRKILPTNSYLIVLKRKEKLLYDVFGVLENDSTVGDANLSNLNNGFFYLSNDITLVKADEVITDSENDDGAVLGANVLLYGVPGAGKSYTVEQEYTKGSANVERVVFHPDYTYSDFVGQILPKVVDGKALYDFVPGPFTRKLKDAVNDEENHHWLVIEEINRGNAPAIFGDVFQLLDRAADGSSEYEITNADIAEVVYSNPNEKVRIPANLSIIATMNTSDQNVFTLDTAFQRRWKMRMIDNDFETCTDIGLMNAEVLDTGVAWKDFAQNINKQIVAANENSMVSTADKQLGTHFVSADELCGDGKQFAEKVLKYLWDDAVKMNHDQIFASDYNELRLVIKDFSSNDGGDRLKVFNKTINDKLQEIIDSFNTGKSDETNDAAQVGSDVD